MNRQEKNGKNYKSGFSLLEMLVVVAIVIIVTGVILASLPSFRSNISIDLVAIQVATIVREAQVYGISQKASKVKENLDYGITFDRMRTTNDDEAEFKDFYLYANTDDRFEMRVNEKERVFTLPGDIIFEKIITPDGPGEYNRIDILFPQRYPEPIFCARKGVDVPIGCGSPFSLSKVQIIISSKRLNKKKAIEIWQNGQISVENYND